MIDAPPPMFLTLQFNPLADDFRVRPGNDKVHHAKARCFPPFVEPWPVLTDTGRKGLSAISRAGQRFSFGDVEMIYPRPTSEALRLVGMGQPIRVP